MPWNEKTIYDLARAVIDVEGSAADVGGVVNSIVTVIQDVIGEKPPTIEEALDAFEVQFKDWVNQRIEEEIQASEASDLMNRYRGLRERFAVWAHDAAPGDALTDDQKTELKNRLVDLAESFSGAMPFLTDTTAYKLEVLPVFPLWVTFHMGVLRELQRQDPTDANSVDEQYRIDTYLKEYLKAAHFVSARILHKIFDPTRIDRKDHIQKSPLGGDVMWVVTLSWEDKRTGKKESFHGEWYELEEDHDPLGNLLKLRERSIRNYLMGKYRMWDQGIGLINGMDQFKELSSKPLDDPYWADVDLLQTWNTLPGTLSITPFYGSGGGKAFYLFPTFVNARLATFECWHDEKKYVNGLRLSWEDGSSSPIVGKQEGNHETIDLKDGLEIHDVSIHCGTNIDFMELAVQNNADLFGRTRKSYKLGGPKGTQKEENIFAKRFSPANARLIGVAGEADAHHIKKIEFIAVNRPVVDTSFPG